jgi:hypothetical protein
VSRLTAARAQQLRRPEAGAHSKDVPIEKVSHRSHRWIVAISSGINIMKIELPKNYTIELVVTKSNCFGRIYHPGIRQYVNKVGFFIASIIEESRMFVECLTIDLSLRNDLKFDPRKNISVDARDPQGFAGPDEGLLKELSQYQNSNLSAYSSELPGYIVDAVRKNFNSTLPIGLNLWEITEGRFSEYGRIWKDDV